MYALQPNTTSETHWLAALARIKTYLGILKARINQPVAGFLAVQNTELTPVEVLRLRHLLLISQRLLQAEVLVSSPTASVQLGERLLDMIWLLAKQGYGLSDQTLEKALHVLQQKILSSTQIAETDKALLSTHYQGVLALLVRQKAAPPMPWPNALELSQANLPNFNNILVSLRGHQAGQIVDERYTQALNELEVELSEHAASELIDQLKNPLPLHWRNHLAAAQHLGIALQAIGKPDRALQWYARLCQSTSVELAPWLGYYLVRVGELISGVVPALQPDWSRYRANLAQHRDQLKQALQPSDRQYSLEALKRFNQDIKSFTRQLWEEAQALCGPQPADLTFCLVSLGSMSRGMMTAYSDVEYALLVGEAKDYPDANPPTAGSNYLRRLMELFEFKVESLGEAEGYHLDPASQPRTEPAVLGTVSQILKGCLSRATEGHDGLVYSLLHPLYLYGDEGLFKSYTNELTNALQQACTKKDALQVRLPLWSSDHAVNWHYYWAQHQFKRNQKEYENHFIKKTETSDLKKPYVKLLTFIPLDLALYLNLPAHDFQTACAQLRQGEYLPTIYLNELQTHLSDLQIERSRQHLQQQKQDETAQPTHQAKLKQIEREILTPFFVALPTLQKQGYVAFQQKLWEVRAQVLLENLNNLEAGQASSSTTTFASYRLISNDKVSEGKLSAALTQKLFKADGKVQGTTEERNSAYFELTPELCIKLVEPDKSESNVQVEALNEYLLREYAVSQLAQLLGFAVIPAGCIIELTHQGKTYYGWLAQKVEGRELGNAISKAPHLIQKLDPISYSQLVLLSLITYPEDGQPRNFMISSQANTKGHYRLWSVDNKRNFVEPFTTVKGWLSSSNKINVKTVLYLLQQAQSTLSSEVFAECKKQDAHELRKLWLGSIESMQQQLDKVPGLKTKREELAKKKAASQTAGLELLLLALLERWRIDLVPALDEKNPSTALALLKQFEPTVHTEYQQCIEKIKKSNLSLEHFDKIFEGDYRTNKQGQTFTKTTAEALSKAQVRSQALFKRLFEQNSQYSQYIKAPVWKTMRQHEQLSWLKLLKDLKLRELRLSDCSVLNDEDLQAMLKQSGTSLRILDISNCAAISAPKIIDWLSNWNINVEEITMNGLARLEQIILPDKLTKLKIINVKNCPNLQLVDGTKVRALAGCSILDSPLVVVKPEKLAIFAKILVAMHRDDPQLKLINLRSQNIGIEELQLIHEALKKNKTVTKIELDRDKLKIVEQELLEKIEVALWRNRNIDLLGPILANDNGVTEINLSDHNIGDAEVQSLAEALKTNRSVTRIDLSFNNIGAAGAHSLAEVLKTNSSVTKIGLRENNIGDAEVQSLAEALKTNRSVTEIDLRENNIGAAGVQTLLEMLKVNRSLTKIDFSSEDIDGKLLEKIEVALWRNRNIDLLGSILANDNGVTEISLSDHNIGDAEVQSLAEALKTNSSVTSIYLWNNNIGAAGAHSLAEVLKTNRSVTSIYLSNNNIGDAGAQALAEALKTNRSVTSIYLERNDIGAAGAQALAETLKTNRSVTKINLYGNNIGDAGAQALAEALKTNSSVTEIDLMRNNIGDAGAQALAEALKTNSSVTKIGLRENNIGDAGAQALAEALKTNSSVTEIDLRENNIGDAEVQWLAEALKTNSSVTKINLYGNNIGDAGAQALAEALKTNSSVTEIDLDWNNIGSAGAQALAEIKESLERNRTRAKASTAVASASNSSVVNISHTSLPASPTTDVSSQIHSSSQAATASSTSSFFAPATASESTTVDSLPTQTEIQRNYAELLQRQAEKPLADINADDFDDVTDDAELSDTEDAETSEPESPRHSPR